MRNPRPFPSSRWIRKAARATAHATERASLFSLGVQRRQESEPIASSRERREALCDHGGGARGGRLQSQFRPGRRSQPQSLESGDRPARPQLRRRSEYRHHAGARLHHRASPADIVTVAKHFPGHGSSHVDSHKALADVSETWKEIELEPYRNLAKEGMLDAVMIGHLYHPRFSDGAKLPALLSRRAVQRRSRDELYRLRRHGGQRRYGDGSGER